MAHRLWSIWLVCGLIAIGTVKVLPYAELTQMVITVAAIMLILVGVRRHRPPAPHVWYVVMAAHSMTLLGQVSFAVGADIGSWFYSAAGPILIVGLTLLVRARTGGKDRAGFIDTAVISTGVAVLCWTFLMRPVAYEASLDLASRLEALAYPTIDVLVLALIVRLLTTAGTRTLSLGLLTLALASMLVADLAYAIAEMRGTDGGDWTLAWPVGFVLWGAAAAHPSMRTLTDVAPAQAATLSGRRLAVLTLTSMLAPGVLVVQGLTQPTAIDWAGIAAGSIILFLLVVARISGLVAQIRQQSVQLEIMAHTDALTGVPNRRAWDLRLAIKPLSGQVRYVALIDIDYFKKFNDQHGHQAGDRLLKEAASAWAGQLRSSDLIARYGGEEFGVVLDCGTADQAFTIMSRLQAVTPQGQSFSAGLARWTDGEAGVRVVERADAALYQAKEAGRNRVVSADAETPVVMGADLTQVP